MAKDALPRFRPGQRLRAEDLNAIVEAVVRRIHGPDMYADGTGVYFRRSPRSQGGASSQRDAWFVIVTAREAFDQTDATFIGDVVWWPTDTHDPDPDRQGLVIDNFANAFYGDAGSVWFCVRQSPSDRFIAIQGTCPQVGT